MVFRWCSNYGLSQHVVYPAVSVGVGTHFIVSFSTCLTKNYNNMKCAIIVGNKPRHNVTSVTVDVVLGMVGL